MQEIRLDLTNAGPRTELLLKEYRERSRNPDQSILEKSLTGSQTEGKGKARSRKPLRKRFTV